MNRPEINVTPLIDVLLVLLIIFMVITPVKPSAFDAKIPSEPTKDPIVKDHPDTLVVSYLPNARLAVNRDVVDASIEDTSRLTKKLKDIFALRDENANRERTVFIKAPRSLNYGSVAVLIDAVKAAGADPVSLQIDGLE